MYSLVERTRGRLLVNTKIVKGKGLTVTGFKVSPNFSQNDRNPAVFPLRVRSWKFRQLVVFLPKSVWSVQCKHCKKRIYWAKNEKGKSLPISIDSKGYWCGHYVDCNNSEPVRRNKGLPPYWGRIMNMIDPIY